MKIAIYYTAFLVNDWRSIIKRQLEYFDMFNIFDKIDKMFVYCYPYTEDIKTIFNNDKIQFIKCDHNEYEFPALRDMINTDYDIVFYMHTKGVTYIYDQNKYYNVLKWGDLMTYINLKNFNTACESILNNKCDCGGILFKQNPYVHYSGNFFFSSKQHLNKLNGFHFGDRYDAEKMICSIPGNYMSFYSSDLNFYETSVDITKVCDDIQIFNIGC